MTIEEKLTVIGYKWILKIKYKANEIVKRYKAKLVAKGCIQTKGIDYLNTLCPVTMMTTIRLLLSLIKN